jgi:NAD(P)-dependent dehydrogenase (short-subunit alcohol dehydrogenase family)
MNSKVALVTGAAAGIGRASAIAFARAGHRVVVADISVAGGEETCRIIKSAGGDAAFVKTDVAKTAEVQALMDRTIQLYGGLDCAHNNAGIEHALARTADLSEEDWDRVLNINLKGVWLCMKHEIRHMRGQGRGAIVNTASVAGLVGVKKLSIYSASKHGIVGLTKSAALEYGQHGIRINAVCPGLIETEMVDRLVVGEGGNPLMRKIKKIGARSVLGSKLPAGRLGTADEVANAVVWLCSDAASYVNGQALAVDGGFTAQ